jgi:hypothetical protein
LMLFVILVVENIHIPAYFPNDILIICWENDKPWILGRHVFKRPKTWATQISTRTQTHTQTHCCTRTYTHTLIVFKFTQGGIMHSIQNARTWHDM